MKAYLLKAVKRNDEVEMTRHVVISYMLSYGQLIQTLKIVFGWSDDTTSKGRIKEGIYPYFPEKNENRFEMDTAVLEDFEMDEQFIYRCSLTEREDVCITVVNENLDYPFPEPRVLYYQQDKLSEPESAYDVVKVNWELQKWAEIQKRAV